VSMRGPFGCWDAQPARRAASRRISGCIDIVDVLNQL
jgi:hypothetical protein